MGRRPPRAGDALHQPLRAGDRRGDHQGAGAGLPRARDGRLGPALPHRDPGRGPAHAARPFIWHMFHARRGGGASPAGDGWPTAGEGQAAGGIKFGSVEVAEVRFPLFFAATSSGRTAAATAVIAAAWAPSSSSSSRSRSRASPTPPATACGTAPAGSSAARTACRIATCCSRAGATARAQDQGGRHRRPAGRRVPGRVRGGSGGGGGWGDGRPRAARRRDARATAGLGFVASPTAGR